MLEFCFSMFDNMQINGGLRGPLVIGGSWGAPAGSSARPVPFPPVRLGAYAAAGLDQPRRRLPRGRRRPFSGIVEATCCAPAGISGEGG
jgi:hypothetical protein